ncbi:hypothetical protein UA08_09519 [Talaromyces atroroseus]|uniref:Uncharacterized protein n=1 Tax=Talaromyces atroroseus TaxID=1441469 RepID=A0A1Q5Q6D5_TALAT|nr:hypothetical protein UA08_09519 [Talaromyces atroroseus]OKL55210.1 hypothetical protein UA08_09519 [Talaromyces atroroseus]
MFEGDGNQLAVFAHIHNAGEILLDAVHAKTFNDHISWDPRWSDDIVDGLTIARAFLESSDQESAPMDLDSDTEVTSFDSDHDGEDDTFPVHPKHILNCLLMSPVDLCHNPGAAPISSQVPPPADTLYLTKADGGQNLRPRPVEGGTPWRQLARVNSAPLDTWKIYLGDIVTVCIEKERENYAKISEIRRLEDGRYMVVYTWLYAREEVQAEFETDGVMPDLLRKNLDQRWPADATFQYMLSTNRTITLWDTAISRAPKHVVDLLCHSSIYNTTHTARYIWSLNSPRFKWMKQIHDLGAYNTV